MSRIRYFLTNTQQETAKPSRRRPSGGVGVYGTDEPGSPRRTHGRDNSSSRGLEAHRCSDRPRSDVLKRKFDGLGEVVVKKAPSKKKQFPDPPDEAADEEGPGK